MMASALPARLQVKCCVIRRSELQVAYEFHDTSALVNSRDLRMMSGADVRIRIGERWMIDEIRRIRGQVETHPLEDGEGFVNRAIDHVQARSVEIIAAVVSERSRGR